MSSAFRCVLPNVFGKNWWNAFQYMPRIINQSFGGLLLDSDLQEPRFVLDRAVRPRTEAYVAKSGFSEVAVTEKEFRIKLDTIHFKPEEVQVKVVGQFVVVHGKHEVRTADKEGTVSREFTRRYMLPEGCDSEGVTASWDTEGSLVIITPRMAKGSEDAREVPIQGAAEKPKQDVEIKTTSPEKPKADVVKAVAAEKPKADVVKAVAAEKSKENVVKAVVAEKPKEDVEKAVAAEKSKEEVQTLAG